MSRWLIPVLLVLGGCSTTSHVSTAQMNYFKPDCRYKQEQLSFLRSQIDNTHDRQVNQLLVNSSMGTVTTLLDGTYPERQRRAQGWDRALIMNDIRYLESYCR